MFGLQSNAWAQMKICAKCRFVMHVCNTCNDLKCSCSGPGGKQHYSRRTGEPYRDRYPALPKQGELDLCYQCDEGHDVRSGEHWRKCLTRLTA